LEFPGYPGLPEQPLQVQKIPAFFQQVQNERFDLAIQMHGSGTITNPMTVLLGAPINAGFFWNVKTFHLWKLSVKQHELKNKFIHDLLRGSITDEADILRQGQILGMDFTRPRAVILIIVQMPKRAELNR